jgi:hypothetical protein
MSDVTELTTLESALSNARSALSQAENSRAEYEVRTQALRVEVAGLEAAIGRRRAAFLYDSRPTPEAGVASSAAQTAMQHRVGGGSQLSVTDQPPFGGVATGAEVGALVLLLVELHQMWAEKKRASAVELVLATAKRPVHRTAITEALQRVGRPNETLQDVAAALAYLNRKGRARPIGDGFWVHIDFVGATLLVDSRIAGPPISEKGGDIDVQI